MIRYDTRCYVNVRSKANIGQLNLPHGNQQLKSGKNEKKLESKNWYAQKYRQTDRGIRGVSLEEEREGYWGKDLQKREVLSLEWKSEGMTEY